MPSLVNSIPWRCGSSDLAKILDGGKEGGRDLDMIEVIEEIAHGVGRGWCVQCSLFAYLVLIWACRSVFFLSGVVFYYDSFKSVSASGTIFVAHFCQSDV